MIMLTGIERELGGEYWRDTVVRGAWDTEPHDWGSWVDDETGLVCLIRRNYSGVWCGYVIVPPGHPIFARSPASDDDVYHDDLTTGCPVWLDVHGGVTFDGRLECKAAGVRGHAVGFDCAHSRDVVPLYAGDYYFGGASGEYRTADFAVEQVTSLAKQIAEYQPVAQLISGTSGG